MAKDPNEYPTFTFRISDDLRDWFKEYSQRTGKPMGLMLKEYIEQLKRKDERAQRKTQEAST
jgi:predicted DNA-binding protein